MIWGPRAAAPPTNTAGPALAPLAHHMEYTWFRGHQDTETLSGRVQFQKFLHNTYYIESLNTCMEH